MPAGAAGEAVLFDEQDIAPAELREVPRHGGSGDTAADDEDTGAGGERSTHKGKSWDSGLKIQACPSGPGEAVVHGTPLTPRCHRCSEPRARPFQARRAERQ
jgi:hypothetical protein